ncbi:swi5-dependent recombination DNA repair protein 1 homolog [Scomber japonicus]|uniref:swi5-dependent recombination DNA repair protein 1 homolog n=1 Tax=Scomber japonicus TaxID=13676 RepID=UPI002304F2D2|nr:swi5-dependent recombination DNA repair protein 1 homolog [Scomber japonicus]
MDITPKTERLKSVFSPPCDSVESSPTESKQVKSHPQLSASLRERLKRSRRSFTSPFSVAKRLCVEEGEEEEDGQQVSAKSRETFNNTPLNTLNVDINRNEARSGSERLSEATHTSLVPQRQQLSREIKDKTETLRRLKMVKMYRSKNDLKQLQTLIDKWRSCAQAALYELQSEVPVDGGKASLSVLIDLFSLDDTILHFDRTEEDFTI